MKKLIFMLAVAAVFTACNSSKSEAEREKADSIAAEATADSLLKAASDTTAIDSVKVDSLVTDSIK